MAAALVLQEAGYLNLTNIEEGFEGGIDDSKHRSTINGWRFHGLPWQQS
jgi:rhodanese-related sulfurtransferase